jgi:hypothetical protein
MEASGGLHGMLSLLVVGCVHEGSVHLHRRVGGREGE